MQPITECKWCERPVEKPNTICLECLKNNVGYSNIQDVEFTLAKKIRKCLKL